MTCRLRGLVFAWLFVPVTLIAQETVDTLQQPSEQPVTQPLDPRNVVLDSAMVHDLIAERVASGRNKGIAVAVVDGAGVRYFSAGVTRDTAGVAIDHNTVFEIGSATKVLTALLLAEMAERNELRLENPAAMYMPDTMRMPAEGGDSITLLHLATHTSGLPRLPLNLNLRDMRNPYGSYGPQQLYAFLSGYQMQRRPGARYEYSNLGAGLLGHLLSLHGGGTYQALLLERVLRPLGMRETMITLGPTLQQRFATGHDALGSPTAAWDFDVLAGGGAVRSTTADMALLVRACLDADRTADDRPIMRAIRASMRRHIVVEEGRAAMGLGWHIFDRGGRTLVMHNGRTGGYAAFIGLDPDRRLGVVLLTNSSAPVDDIGLALLNP